MTVTAVTLLLLFSVLLHPGKGAKYCDEYVCLSVRLFLCLFVCFQISEAHMAELYQIFCACFPV